MSVWVDEFGTMRHGAQPGCSTCWDAGWVASGEAKTADHILTDTVPSKPCPSCSDLQPPKEDE